MTDDEKNERMRELRQVVRAVIQDIEREKQIIEGRWVASANEKPISMKGYKQ